MLANVAGMTGMWDDLAVALSHDLPAPLRSMLGFNRLCLEDGAAALTPQILEHLQRVHDAGSLMSRMLSAVASFVEMGRVPLRTEVIHLDALARSIIEKLRLSDPSRRIEFNVSASAAVTVMGDPRLLRILLEAVLGNAWKFTVLNPDARIDLAVIDSASAQTWLVRDNGVGFQMKHAARLFTLFKRLHRHDEFPGLGTGLALAQQVARRHGGRIAAESAIGHGALFSITMPRPNPSAPTSP